MISVALCTYNGERFLRQQLDSILSQSFQVDEIVAIDDCSTDKTNSILEDYAFRFPQIKYIRNEKNIGFIRNEVHMYGAYQTYGHSFGEWSMDRNRSLDWYDYPTENQVF